MADPIDPKYHDQLNSLAGALDQLLNGPHGQVRKVGFCLFVFEFGKTEGGKVNYISNGNRQDMIVAVKEWLARQEGRAADPQTVM